MGIVQDNIERGLAFIDDSSSDADNDAVENSKMTYLLDNLVEHGEEHFWAK